MSFFRYPIARLEANLKIVDKQHVHQYNDALDYIKRTINEVFSRCGPQHFLIYDCIVNVDSEEFAAWSIPYIGVGYIYLLHDGRLAYFQSLYGIRIIHSTDYGKLDNCDHIISLDHVNKLPKSSPVGLSLKEIINLRDNIDIFCILIIDRINIILTFLVLIILRNKR